MCGLYFEQGLKFYSGRERASQMERGAEPIPCGDLSMEWSDIGCPTGS